MNKQPVTVPCLIFDTCGDLYFGKHRSRVFSILKNTSGICLLVGETPGENKNPLAVLIKIISSTLKFAENEDNLKRKT